MKPVFGIDVTKDKRSEILNGTEFITKTVSKQHSEALEDKKEGLEQTLEKSRFTVWLNIVKYICGIFALIVITSIVRALDENELSKIIFENAPILTLSGLSCGVIWLILQIISKKKEKKVLEEEDAEQQIDNIDKNIKNNYTELGVPQDAPSTDILFFRYKVKNEEVRPYALPLQTTPYINLDLKIYADEDELHIADVESVYSFKKSELKSIKTINKKISVPSWNKELPPKSPEFKTYKIVIANTGDIFFKPYHVLEIERNGQKFGIYFPGYELETFEKLTGLKAENI